MAAVEWISKLRRSKKRPLCVRALSDWQNDRKQIRFFKDRARQFQPARREATTAHSIAAYVSQSYLGI